MATNEYGERILWVDEAATGSANGLTRTDAFTVAQDAMSPAQSGETIRIIAGGYAKITTLKAGITIVGDSAGSTVITDTSGIRVLTDSVTLKRLSAVGTTQYGIDASVGPNHLVVEQCYLSGSFDGLLATDTSFLRVIDTEITGNFDGLHLGRANHALIENSIIESTADLSNGTYRAITGTVTGESQFENRTNVTIKDSIIRIRRPDAPAGAGNTIGINLSGKLRLINTFIIADAVDAGYTGNVLGITDMGVNDPLHLTMQGGGIYVANAGTGTAEEISFASSDSYVYILPESDATTSGFSAAFQTGTDAAAAAASAANAETDSAAARTAAEAVDDKIINQPRQNKPAGSSYRRKISSLHDGTYKATEPVRPRPGAVNVAVSVDMSPQFGTEHVYAVGTPTVTVGSSITAAAAGPRDTEAMLQLSGTASPGETIEVTFDVTMDRAGGDTVPVTFDVEVFDE